MMATASDWLLQALTSFIAASAFGLLFNAPRRVLLSCGLVGMIGWLIYYAFDRQGGDQVMASFAGAFAVAIAAHMLARKYRMPMIVFSVAGIIPLVPGSKAYNAMRNVVENNYMEAISFAMKAMLVSGAIAMGLVFAEVFMKAIFRSRQPRV